MRSVFNTLTPLIWRALFILSLIGSLIVSLLPHPEHLVPSTGWDKANHSIAFFVLALLGLNAFRGALWRVVVGLSAYGALMELLQGMTTWRAAEWLDLVADLVGILIAVGVFIIVTRTFSTSAPSGSRSNRAG